MKHSFLVLWLKLIDNYTKETRFSSDNLHEAKVEFIVMQSLTSEFGANVFSKATGF